MKFLISNDDGVHAPGLLALYQALSTIGEVMVVAPDAEKSGSASALHISQPLYTHKLESGFVAVNGSPADGVYLALHQLYRNIRFDCVITGINSGANLGQDVLFSGTFGAALTAQLFGVPAIATSLVGGTIKGDGHDKTSHYQMAANEIVKLLRETSILEELKSLPYHVLNVNIPDVKSAKDTEGRKITSLGHSRIARPVHHVVDPRRRDAYWLSLQKCQYESRAATLSGPSQSLVQLDKSTTSIEPVNHTLVTQCANTSSIHTDNQAVAAGYIAYRR
ncbi:5'/3'-nucleotidase SurE [Psychrobacter sp. CAL346-MNA-CIBAN-0220]|uniref:5'/3'-nucleotidase SurE n=1 Tax=Psychrobacter sp. CAL346-MNA-CIBAN-0220 TaxID=3140457 RepID=UPI003330F7DF